MKIKDKKIDWVKLVDECLKKDDFRDGENFPFCLAVGYSPEFSQLYYNCVDCVCCEYLEYLVKTCNFKKYVGQNPCVSIIQQSDGYDGKFSLWSPEVVYSVLVGLRKYLTNKK